MYRLRLAVWPGASSRYCCRHRRGREHAVVAVRDDFAGKADLSPPVVDSPLPLTHGTRHHLSPPRSMLVQISSTLPTPDWGLQHVLAPPLGHQARGRRPSIATPPFICGQLVEGEQDTRVEESICQPQAHRSSSPPRRLLVLEHVLCPASSRAALLSRLATAVSTVVVSTVVADFSANRSLLSSNCHQDYPPSLDTSSSRVLPPSLGSGQVLSLPRT